LNKLPIDKYINKCGEASVLLDTLYFGAGNSFHESMYYGTPTVTLPTQNLKSKIVTGAYKQMQINDPPISIDTDDYVKRAIELANLDPKKMLDLKYHYKKKANELLYENEHFIEEMTTLFIDLFNKNEKTSI
jgi:predicted O-linked N-acetylglucosamine transferase (SPINDLY family)